MGERPSGEKNLKKYFILVKEWAVYAKDEEFFRSQGGMVEPWGKEWERIEARNLHEARREAMIRRRMRFPLSHITIGETPEISDIARFRIKDEHHE